MSIEVPRLSHGSDMKTRSPCPLTHSKATYLRTVVLNLEAKIAFVFNDLREISLPCGAILCCYIQRKGETEDGYHDDYQSGKTRPPSQDDGTNSGRQVHYGAPPALGRA